MQISQSYAAPSRAALREDGLHFAVSTEQARPPVHLEAEVRHSFPYAQCMLALYDVVASDFRTPSRDYSDYQAWVQERYLEELPEIMRDRQQDLPELMVRREQVAAEIKEARKEVQKLSYDRSRKFWDKQYAYFRWLRKHDMDAWWVLDPVVSVHPDCLIFEVFSLDESSYGRVTVPTANLAPSGEVQYGTTNIDFSADLAREFERVRSYRPASVKVGQEAVSIGTMAGQRVEKKIDLPVSWVRGFLQVQSASAFPSTSLTLSASTVAEVIAVLGARREKEGPRSLRFQLEPGQRPRIVIEPWGVTIAEPHHVYQGDSADEIRVWGRRRLTTLEKLLPEAEEVEVRLLGTGLPSYWSVTVAGHRFDLGLSGWTRNDWAQSASFDLLVAGLQASEGEVALVADLLAEKLLLCTADVTRALGYERAKAQGALQKLCATGRAMYDPQADAFRWRELFDERYDLGEEVQSQHQDQAHRLVEAGKVSWTAPPKRTDQGTTIYRSRVQARVPQSVTLELDADGRIVNVSCTSSWHRREGLRRGPSPYILATVLFLAREGG